jgi:membrane associated rhomboid family serine protease
MSEPVPAPARTPLLGIAWLAAALAVGVVGWLLFALTERASDRGTGAALVTAALVAAMTGVAVLVAGSRVRLLSLVTSGVLVGAGIVAVTVLAYGGDPALTDALLVGGVPALAGIVTGLLALPSGRRTPPAQEDRP